jgi:hypothetical protein
MAIEAEVQLFEENLQEFAAKVGIIVGLESNTSSEIDEAEAYRRIKALFKKLKRSKKGLRIGEDEGEEAESTGA